jgi:hypothetical protein
MLFTPEAKRKHEALQTNFPYFAQTVLKIKDKEGTIKPFVFNRAQEYIHKRLEDQLTKTGKIRAIIVKARQMGSSTYIEGRFYHKTTRNKGKSTFILTHEGESTKKLFEMAKRYHENVPDGLKPATKNSNAKELIFSELDSQYFVGTAGNADVGRGGTVQYFHGSEVGFWKNTDSIVTGVLQSVPDLPGTEIILESTANGIGNMFNKMAVKAANKESEYQLIFIPWFWMPEYEKDCDKLEFSEEEELFIKTYLEEFDEQSIYRKIAWMRSKIEELGREWKFKQEYPATFTEAFQVSGDSLVSVEHVVLARKCKKTDKKAPLIIGVDPARSGDRTVIAFRRGREITHYYTFNEMDEMRLASIIAQLIEKHNPACVNFDVAHGYGTIDRLNEMGYKSINGIHFGERAIENDVYRNIRAEMWCNMAKWLKQPDVSIPDDDEVHADLTAVPDIKYTSDGTIKLDPKEKIKELYGKSPDIGDAFALTFAVPVNPSKNKTIITKGKSNSVSWKKTS